MNLGHFWKIVFHLSSALASTEDLVGWCTDARVCCGVLWIILAVSHQIWDSLPSRSSQAEFLHNIISPALDMAGKATWLKTGFISWIHASGVSLETGFIPLKWIHLCFPHLWLYSLTPANEPRWQEKDPASFSLVVKGCSTGFCSCEKEGNKKKSFCGLPGASDHL